MSNEHYRQLAVSHIIRVQKGLVIFCVGRPIILSRSRMNYCSCSTIPFHLYVNIPIYIYV